MEANVGGTEATNDAFAVSLCNVAPSVCIEVTMRTDDLLIFDSSTQARSPVIKRAVWQRRRHAGLLGGSVGRCRPFANGTTHRAWLCMTQKAETRSA